MRLTMFNTLMGVCAGLALLLVPRLWAVVIGERPPLLGLGRRAPTPSGWAAAFGVLGVVLTVLGLIMTVVHPLAAARPGVDKIMGEPCLLLGVALLAAAVWLACTPAEEALDEDRLRSALAPAAWIVFLLGVVLVWCTFAIIRFEVISSAPSYEPITGLLHDYPKIEQLFFALFLYGPAAIGCLLFPTVVHRRSRTPMLALYWCWTVAGAGFTLFAAMNYYTHTGLRYSE